MPKGRKGRGKRRILRTFLRETVTYRVDARGCAKILWDYPIYAFMQLVFCILGGRAFRVTKIFRTFLIRILGGVFFLIRFLITQSI